MNKKAPILAIIVPCFNEAAVLSLTLEELVFRLDHLVAGGKIADRSYVCFVDDGSEDRTWELIKQFSSEMRRVKGIKLSTNFGHQNALLAGLFNEMESADCLITIDADLQDDVSVIEQMIIKHSEGCKIVYGVRDSRASDSIWKRQSAQFFYRLMKFLKVKTVYNHADFRLADSKVIESLHRFNEVNLFLRGIFPLMGYKSDIVHYSRAKRQFGETKYPLRKMASFAWQGVTSFNTSLLRLVTWVGVSMFFVSMLISLWVLIAFITGNTIHGWTSMLLIITLFSGLNMICLGLIGEYVGKIFLEVKQRPRYLIDESTATHSDIR
ncbi:MAG: glycosyltransferase family 2 protein [Bacteroidales bacterium]|nr:glycosyltransferase family 2 protein [Bacteroidales bacterium]